MCRDATRRQPVIHVRRQNVLAKPVIRRLPAIQCLLTNFLNYCAVACLSVDITQGLLNPQNRSSVIQNGRQAGNTSY